MNIKTTLKSSVAVAALFAVAAPVANAADDTLKSGNKNSLTMSGQVVRMLSHADDGVSDDAFFTDGGWTSSRVRWVAKGSLSANVTAGATIEMNIPTSRNAGSDTLGTHHQDAEAAADDTSWDIRHEYVWVNHKKFGGLKFGNTDTASNGRSESEYNGTTGLFAGSGVAAELPNSVWMDTSTASAPTTSGISSIGAAISNFDGGSRDDVVRYDTPRFYGLQLAASYIAGGMFDVGADYQGKFGPVKVRAQAGFLDYGSNHASKNFNASGSISVLHDSGLNATFAIGKTNFAGAASKDDGAGNASQAANTGVATDAGNDGVEDPNFIYWGIGYQAKVFGVGGTNFSFGWNQTNDLIQTSNIEDAEADAITFAVVQNFDSIGAQVGLKYQKLTLDAKSSTGADRTFDDIDVITLGTIFKF